MNATPSPSCMQNKRDVFGRDVWQSQHFAPKRVSSSKYTRPSVNEHEHGPSQGISVLKSRGHDRYFFFLFPIVYSLIWATTSYSKAKIGKRR